MPRVYIGRTHDLYGKSLWELLCNLKDFGVGRVIKRTKFNRRYPEASWYRVISAQPEMDKVRLHSLMLFNTGPLLIRDGWSDLVSDGYTGCIQSCDPFKHFQE